MHLYPDIEVHAPISGEVYSFLSFVSFFPILIPKAIEWGGAPDIIYHIFVSFFLPYSHSARSFVRFIVKYLTTGSNYLLLESSKTRFTK